MVNLSDPNRVTLYDPSGKAWSIPSESIDIALKSGYTAIATEDIEAASQIASQTEESISDPLETPGTIPMVDSTGSDLWMIPEANRNEALKKGYRYATEVDIEKYKEWKEYGGGSEGMDYLVNLWKTGSLGAGRGLTFGLTDWLAQKPGAMIPGGAIAKQAMELTGTEKRAREILELVKRDMPVVGSAIETAMSPFATKEQIQAYKEQNPGLSIGTEIAGALLPLALTGGGTAPITTAKVGTTGAARALGVGGRTAVPLVGEATAAVPTIAETARAAFGGGRALAGGAGTASAVGKVTGSAIENLALAITGTGTKRKIVADILKRMTGSAAEGAVYGLGHAVSKGQLDDDPDFLAETLMSDIGFGAVAGGGIGLLSGIGSHGLPIATKAAGNSIKWALDKAGARATTETIRGKVGDIYSKISQLRTGIAQDDIIKLFEALPEEQISNETLLKIVSGIKEVGIENVNKAFSKLPKHVQDQYLKKLGELRRSVASMSDDHFVNAVGEYSDIIGRNLAAVDDINAGLFGVTREAALSSALGRIKSNEVQTIIIPEVRDLVVKMANAITEMQQKPATFLYKRGIKDLQMVRQEFENRLNLLIKNTGSTDARPYYDLVNEFKRNIQLMAKYGKDTPPAHKATYNKIKEIANSFRTSLEKSEVYGGEVITISKINNAFSGYINAVKELNKNFGRKTVDKGRVVYKVDPNKVRMFLRDPEALNNVFRKEALEQVSRRSRALANLQESELMTPEALVAIKRLRAGLSHQEQIQTLLDKYGNWQLVRKLESQARGTFADLVRVGAGVGSFFQAGVGWPEALVVAAQVGRNPATEIAMLRKLQNIYAGWPNRINRAVKDFFDVTTSKVPPETVATLGGLAWEKIEDGKKKRRRETYNSLQDRLNSYINNPDLLEKNIAMSMAEFSSIVPNAANSTRVKTILATQFLHSKMPKTPKIGTELDPARRTMPSNIDIAKFERYVAVVNDPKIFFKDLENGIVSVEGAEALRVVYPEIFNKFRDTAFKYLQSPNVSFQQKMKLMTIFGMGTDKLVFYQRAYSMPTQQQQAPPSKKRSVKLKRGNEKDVYERNITNIQRVSEK
jgi:hypothetical protein